MQALMACISCRLHEAFLHLHELKAALAVTGPRNAGLVELRDVGRDRLRVVSQRACQMQDRCIESGQIVT